MQDSDTPDRSSQDLAAALPLQEALFAKLTEDPFSLGHDERIEVLRALDEANQHWSSRLAVLIEVPSASSEFPAFLLDTPRFAELRAAIGESEMLDTGTADELQYFVDHYRDYLDPEAEPRNVDSMFASPATAAD